MEYVTVILLVVAVWTAWVVVGWFAFGARIGDKNKPSTKLQEAIDWFLMGPVMITWIAVVHVRYGFDTLRRSLKNR